MDRMTFNTYNELAEYMFTKADDGYNITSTLFVGDAMELLKMLMRYEEIDIGEINISQPEYNGYDKEYYISLSSDMTLNVQAAQVDGIYIYAEPDIMLIHGDASSSIIKTMNLDDCVEIYIRDGICSDNAYAENDEDYDYDKNDVFDTLFDNAELIKDSTGEPIGISIDIVKVFKNIFK